MDKATLFENARNAIVEFDEELAMATYEEALAQDIDLLELLSQGYSVGIRELGEMYASGEIFVPELLCSAELMKKVTERIETNLGTSDLPQKGKFVIGTVQGDIHDIGKGIVCSIVKSNGIEVIDLGRDVPPQAFIDEAEACGADFIGSSALLTTTMTGQKKIEELLREQGKRDRYKTLVGGAPVTTRWAEKIGADAYCEDASETVGVLLKWIDEMK